MQAYFTFDRLTLLEDDNVAKFSLFLAFVHMKGLMSQSQTILVNNYTICCEQLYIGIRHKA